MTEVAIVAPDGGELIELGPARMRILEDGGTTAHRLGIGEITLAPHSDGPQQHRHAKHDEGFYVVSGTARFTVGRATYDAPPGTMVMVPPGAPHTFANPGDEPLVIVNTFTPDLYVQYFRDLRDALADGRQTPAQAAAQAMSRYATTPATDYAPDPVSRALTRRTVELRNGLTITVDEYGEVDGAGNGALVLHGGAGPRSVAGLAAALSQHSYVVVPTHPGFDATPRPDGTDSVADLASAYLDLIEELGLRTVLVLGSSVGGWIAAEMGLRDNHDRISGLVLLAATGIEPEPPLQIADPAKLGPVKTGELAFHDPRLRPDPAALSDEQKAALAANQAALAVYAGGPHFCYDPKLRGRLHRVAVPVLVFAGEQDGIAPLEYERALAASFPRVTFHPVPQAGHFPHLEQPEAVLEAIDTFLDKPHQAP
jgi:pimeloyl-ACP methyl ester carboxylesterase/mannose-6-phosphate isomerase-like protein (cupin superfamily)